MTCEKCGRSGFAKAGPFSMHVRFCRGSLQQRNYATDVSKQSKPPAEAVEDRLARIEEQLELLGRHVPELPTGILLTSRNAKSFLTQFKMNCEHMAKLASQLIDLVDKQEIADFRKAKGFDD